MYKISSSESWDYPGGSSNQGRFFPLMSNNNVNIFRGNTLHIKKEKKNISDISKIAHTQNCTAKQTPHVN